MADWSIPFDEIARAAQSDIDTAVRAVTLFAFKKVILKSPVDTGRFRANWNVSYGVMNTSTSDATDDSATGASTVSKMASVVNTAPLGGIVYMTNSLPYAGVIEFGQYPNPPKMGSRKRGESGMTIHVINGYSMQAPAGVVRVSIIETINAFASLVQQKRNGAL